MDKDRAAAGQGGFSELGTTELFQLVLDSQVLGPISWLLPGAGQLSNSMLLCVLELGRWLSPGVWLWGKGGAAGLKDTLLCQFPPSWGREREVDFFCPAPKDS